MRNKTILRGPSVKVEMDTNEIFPNDPGMGTPVMVIVIGGGTATWNCAINEGETDEEKLTDEQMKWLNQITPQVEKWMMDNGV